MRNSPLVTKASTASMASTAYIGFRWIAAALIICFVVPAALAQEKKKSVWVKADEMMAQENYAEAARLYTIAIEINADDSDIHFAYFNRAQALLNIDQVDAALSDYSETIRLNPRFKEAYRMRGIVYVKIRRYTDAVNDFSRLIDLDPESSSGYANRGSALSYLGSYDKAAADLTRSIEIDPECATCYYIRYQIFTVMGKDSEADRDLKMAQSLDSRYKGDE